MKKAGIRAIKTVAQTAVATIGTAQVMGQVDWRMVASASVLAGGLSILTSIATGLPEVELSDPEYLLVKEQQAKRIQSGEFEHIDYTEEANDDVRSI